MTEVGGAGGGAGRGLSLRQEAALWMSGGGDQDFRPGGLRALQRPHMNKSNVSGAPSWWGLGPGSGWGAEEAGSHCLPPPTCSPCIAASSVSGVQKLHGPGRSRHSLSCLQLAAQHLSTCLQPPSSAGGSSTHSSAQPSTHAAPCPGLSPSCTVMISPALPHAPSEGGKSTFLQMTDQKTKPARPGHRLREHSEQLRAAEI